MGETSAGVPKDGVQNARVDVVMLTKDSMKPSLAKTFGSVYAGIPVNRIIVVDGGSSDGTIEFASKQRDVLIVDDSRGTRATARQKGIEKVETEFFAFVDSDIVLPENWFSEAFALIGPRVGAVSTYPRYFGTAGRAQEALERMYGRPTKRRFDTAAALLRTEALRGIQIPIEDRQVPSEDEFIGRALEAEGYQVFCVGNPVAYHKDAPHRADLMAKGRLLRATRWRSTKYMAQEFALSIPEGLFILFCTGSLKAAWMRVRNHALALFGYLAPV